VSLQNCVYIHSYIFVGIPVIFVIYLLQKRGDFSHTKYCVIDTINFFILLETQFFMQKHNRRHVLLNSALFGDLL